MPRVRAEQHRSGIQEVRVGGLHQLRPGEVQPFRRSVGVLVFALQVFADAAVSNQGEGAQEFGGNHDDFLASEGAAARSGSSHGTGTAQVRARVGRLPWRGSLAGRNVFRILVVFPLDCFNNILS